MQNFAKFYLTTNFTLYCNVKREFNSLNCELGQTSIKLYVYIYKLGNLIL